MRSGRPDLGADAADAEAQDDQHSGGIAISHVHPRKTKRKGADGMPLHVGRPARVPPRRVGARSASESTPRLSVPASPAYWPRRFVVASADLCRRTPTNVVISQPSSLSAPSTQPHAAPTQPQPTRPHTAASYATARAAATMRRSASPTVRSTARSANALRSAALGPKSLSAGSTRRSRASISPGRRVSRRSTSDGRSHPSTFSGR